MYQLINHYRDNEPLRRSFNELAKSTFGIDFEDWYQNGFWGDSYNPYSVVADGRVIANVSVNRTDMAYEGTTRHFFQLGTVMTEEAYRNQGLCRKLMEWIAADLEESAEGIYLFANDSVLDFYPKFGFKKAAEYQYARELSNGGSCQFEKVAMDAPVRWKALERTMEQNVFHGGFDLVGNRGLIMFYITKYMQDNVYYHRGTDTYVIAEQEKGKMFIHQIFSGMLTELGAVTELFGKDVHEVTLGFTPTETEGYNAAAFKEEDCTFFIKGQGMEVVEREKLRIPTLAHA